MSSKVALICGYGIGISVAVAKKLGSQGFKLALISRTQTKLDAAAAELGKLGYAAKGYAADLGDYTAVKAVVATIQKDLGPIHVLFWNPYGPGTHYTTATPEQLADPYNSSVTGLIAAFQASHEDLKAAKGAVLVTGGSFSQEDDLWTQRVVDWGVTSLSLAKAAQRRLVHVMHKGLAKEDIYVAEVTVMDVVKDTAFDADGKATLTAESIADEFWALYTKRDPEVWFVKI